MANANHVQRHVTLSRASSRRRRAVLPLLKSARSHAVRGMHFVRCLFGRDLALADDGRPRGRSRRAADLMRAFSAAAQNWPAELADEDAPAQRSALIVTGDIGQRRFCETFLRALGLRVDIAQTPAQALAAVAQDAYGMVIVDASLPELDSAFWVRLFDELMDARLSRPPHLYLVTDEAGGRAETFRHLGAHRAISRPVRALALVEAIERLGL